MDGPPDVYSLILAIAMGCAAVALAGGLWVWRGRSAGRPYPLVRTLARLAAWGGVGGAIAAASVHVAVGHTPGSERALSAAAFVREHPALVATGAVSLVLALLCRGKARPG